MMLVAKETSWQRQLSDLITDPAELLSALNLSPGDYPVSDDILAGFPLKVPRAFVRRMRPGDPRDPLLRQVLPVMEESDDTPGFVIDPLSESDFNPQAGILHKYQGRILVLAAPHCAIHCRYCFRRHFPYDENIPGKAHWEESLQWLAERPDIREVIYSGGDPLAANDRHLAWLTKRISDIPHIRRLRIHTRTPVVIPDRVSDSLLAWLNDCQLQKIMVVHINHAQEIDTDVVKALQKLRSANVTLLNQSVLLKGVNDSVDALAELSEALIDVGVMPYYLHMLDRVQGVAHFDVSDDKAFALMDKLRARLPGFLIPSLVREEPGKTSKTRLV